MSQHRVSFAGEVARREKLELVGDDTHMLEALAVGHNNVGVTDRRLLSSAIRPRVVAIGAGWRRRSLRVSNRECCQKKHQRYRYSSRVVHRSISHRRNLVFVQRKGHKKGGEISAAPGDI